ncbi:MAG: ATP-binding cassette domain-containing protein [Desulfurococcales archaeon]|nr:ATP-binding cassette domain-containing protein [Desulfurococcales archaeon]
MPELFLENVNKRYGKVHAVKNVNIKVEDGKIMSLLGPSGCGKTTTLRIIAGLTSPDEGRIILGGKDITNLPPEKRNMGMVFQNYAVWPHMNVYENVAFPLRGRRLSDIEIDKRVKEALELVKMYELRDRYPHQLSGGQQQRVALARAIAVYPEVILLDEPLSNLDARLREEMRVEIRELQKKLKFTAVYVTHDQIEAFTISDKIAVMSEGKIIQVGAPKELYYNPANEFVANFLGKVNIMDGEVVSIDDSCMLVVRTYIGNIKASPKKGCREDLVGSKVFIGIRPMSFTLLNGNNLRIEENIINGTILSSMFLGELFEYKIELEGGKVITAQSTEEFKEGNSVKVHINPDKVLILASSS